LEILVNELALDGIWVGQLWVGVSDDPVELGRVVESQVNHLRAGDLSDFLALFDKVETVSADFPADVVFLVVLFDEVFEFFLVLDHEHLLHVRQLERFIRSLSGTSNLVADGISKLVNEKVISKQRHVLLRRQNFLIAALDEVSLKRHWHFDIDVILKVFLVDQLDLRVILRNPNQSKSKV
jgi:hypothetical protein